uniref:Synaptogyrin 3 n=1 Tax=Rhinopithecus bieti TaxID=61621 RepID=A0A2K6MPN2_RHIBE
WRAASLRRGAARGRPGPVSFARPAPQTPLARVLHRRPSGPSSNEGYGEPDSGPELRCVFNGIQAALPLGVAACLGAFLACARLPVSSMGQGKDSTPAPTLGSWPLFSSRIPVGSDCLVSVMVVRSIWSHSTFS